MVGLLSCMWNPVSGKRQSDLQIKIDNILEFLHSTDEETCMLGFSLALEILPEDILNRSYLIDELDYCFSQRHFLRLYKNPGYFTVRDICNIGLNHKKFEPVRKYSYNLLYNSVLSLQKILYNIETI